MTKATATENLVKLKLIKSNELINDFSFYLPINSNNKDDNYKPFPNSLFLIVNTNTKWYQMS